MEAITAVGTRWCTLDGEVVQKQSTGALEKHRWW